MLISNQKSNFIFSKKLANQFYKKDKKQHSTRKDNLILFKQKLEQSKNVLELFKTEKSQSEVNQTFNHLSPNQQLEYRRISEFHIKTFIRFRPQKNRQFPIKYQEKNVNSKIAVIDKKKILCQDNFFVYDHVFQQSSQQKDIYEAVCREMVEHFIRGFNSTVFAYGQTGSGKTYTMFGDEDKKKGVIPVAIEDIFSSITDINPSTCELSMSNQVIISCSMLEIYKESMIDLLSNEKSELKIKENQFFNVSNLTIKQVQSREQMFQALKMGNQSKKIRQTHMNEVSSRSHVIFTVYLQIRKQTQKRLSKFNFVDLAGSQKVSKSKVDGEGLQEAKKINLSLSCLGNTINALLKGNDHVPYRESKLTRLLYESLGGNSLTRLIVTCSCEETETQQTLSSLKFASRAKNLKTNPLINTLRKSEKSVSRIAYENLKTNLNKAEYKIKQIKKIVSELKLKIQWEAALSNRLQSKKSKQMDFDDKQNKSLLSNKGNQHSKNSKKCQKSAESKIRQLEFCKEFLQKIENVLSPSNKETMQIPLIDNIFEKRQKSPLKNTSQTQENPFLLISQQTSIHSSQQVSFTSQIKKHSIKLPHKSNQVNQKKFFHQKSMEKLLLSKDDSEKELLRYWKVIKNQQREIASLKEKVNSLQNQLIQEIKQPLFNQNINNEFLNISAFPAASIHSRKNSLSSIQQKNSANNQFFNAHPSIDSIVNITKQNKPLMKVSGKILPVRQIFLKSPTHFKFVRRVQQSPNRQIHKKGKENRHMHQQNQFSTELSEDFKSPREFIPTQYGQQSNHQLQSILKQINGKLCHQSEYERFEKKILIRQIQILLKQKLLKQRMIQIQNLRKQQQQDKLDEQSQGQKKLLQDRQIQQNNVTAQITQKKINLNQVSRQSLKQKELKISKKVTFEETTHLMLSQIKYIEQLQIAIRSCVSTKKTQTIEMCSQNQSNDCFHTINQR